MIGMGRLSSAAIKVRSAFLTPPLQAALWLSAKHNIRGIQVAVVSSKDEDQALSTKIGEALALIADIDPARYRRVTKDLRAIVCIRSVNALGQYNRRLRAWILDLDYVKRVATPGQIAIVIVHEALHARLHCSGMRFSENKAPRLERACIRAEAAFAKRVPGGSELVDWVEGRRAESV